MNLDNIVLLIPAYNPPPELIQFIKNLLNSGFTKIIIVNDGSTEKHNVIFKEIKKEQITLLIHEKNQGKGLALKTGFNYCINNFENVLGLITADADGQHTIEDIINIANQITENEIILGKRLFKTNQVPFKSKLGNFLSRKAISFISKQSIYDTQTGLRFIPKNKLKEISILPGKKFEYETNMLLYAKQFGLKIREIPIKTIYINENKESNFKPLKDGYIIYKSIIKFLFKR
jgi:glycosyltransferase involved in cell wall biosynthesis